MWAGLSMADLAVELARACGLGGNEVLSLLALLVQKYKILTPEELRGPRSSWGQRGTQFTCFTSTKVQILTPEELREWDEEELREIFAHNTFEVLNLLALLVQEYKY
jgi:hypothetical protein